jgi:hypothetical protein
MQIISSVNSALADIESEAIGLIHAKLSHDKIQKLLSLLPNWT